MLNSKGGDFEVKEKEMPKKKKWGKVGAPHSKKRRDWMREIRKKRRKTKSGVKRVKPKLPRRKTRKRKKR